MKRLWHSPSQGKSPLQSLCINHHIVGAKKDHHSGALKKDGLSEKKCKTGEGMTKKKVKGKMTNK